MLPGPAGWNGFLAGRGHRLRKQLRRDQRRLEALGAVRYRSAEASSADLDVLFSLHHSLFGEESRFTEHACFHREFAQIARERGWLRMWFLEVDGKSIAAWYGFRYAGVEFDYQSGRDPAWDDFSVGTLLLTHAIRSAFDDGVAEYRLLRGGEAYKQRFATHDRGLETLVIGQGAVAEAAATAAAVLPGRVAAVAKRRLAA
jgi:CelD/BcsL family acetyltransferase involved in cellulose biosynthesis